MEKWHKMRVLVGLAGILAVLAAGLSCGSQGVKAEPWIGVRGNVLVNGQGDPIRLLGVNRSGLEYRCAEESGFFEGPGDAKSIAAIKSWHVNAVRVPLNESCWLELGGIVKEYGGQAYRAVVRGYVERLEEAGLYVILDLHWAAPGTNRAGGLIAMPDADHALDFWRSVATEFRDDHAIIFDLFNEPRPGVKWNCWENGCENEDAYFGRYPVVGMKAMVKAVRETGATQPLMLSGRDWGQNLRGWLSHVPADPAHALIAANHTYGGFSPCTRSCKLSIERVSAKYPVVTAELGQIDCRHDYVDAYMRWADRAAISYLAWAWNAGSGWGCTEGPSLIDNYNGHPTAYGIGVRNHLRQLQRADG
jgi:endoglucanase